MDLNALIFTMASLVSNTVVILSLILVLNAFINGGSDGGSDGTA